VAFTDSQYAVGGTIFLPEGRIIEKEVEKKEAESIMSRLSIRIEEAILLVLLLGAVVVAATDSNRLGVPPAAPTVPATRSAARMTVYLPVRSGTSVKLVPQALSVPGGIEPRAAAIGYLARPGGVLPKGTVVLGLRQDDGILSIDFSPELKRFSGGSSAEGLLLAALSATVAHFDGVAAFRLSIADRPLTQLAGHADLSEPYPATKLLPEEFR
jgi:hypothetical protein